MNRSSRHTFLSAPIKWHFPLGYAHEGIPLSNGTFGALIWGCGRDLRITINRADFWDHRGGVRWGEEATYENLRRWLEAGDEANLRRVFEGERTGEETDPPRPTRLPMGRVDLRLGDGADFTDGLLDLGSAEASIEEGEGAGVLRAVVVRHDPVLAVLVAGDDVSVASVPPDADEVLEHYRQYGIPAAEIFGDDQRGGWVQELPNDPAMCVAWQKREVEGGTEILVTSVYGNTPEAAREEAITSLEDHAEAGYAQLADRTASWWGGFWDRAAAISTPNADLEWLYYLGMYKLAGLSVPGSPAATLQGTWVEEYRMPPWSSDYHFNINVQECYWPALGGNFVQAFEPLVGLLKNWEPKLRENAKTFAGVDDGLQLPHAVDDRCTCMGGFWTGSIDHGSTSWTGQLLWQRYKHSMDLGFLQETAYPFLKGAMRVYEAMLDEEDGRWSLPVSVSPEFGGSSFDAWGRNASFQLANIHFLCRALVQAAELLGIDTDDRERWRAIDAGLPAGATDPDGRELWLWEGQPLSESHRHHSHLAGIYPFDTLDYHGSAEDRALIDASLATLTRQGMGLWTGWCVPWAAILWARVGNGDMSEVLLDAFRRLFMTRGHASTHDSQFRGFTVMAGRTDVMQIEASLAAAGAVLEVFVQAAQGIIRVFPAMPRWWRDAGFDGIRTEGAFLISGRLAAGKPEVVHILSEAGAPLKMANPFAPALCEVRRSDGGTSVIAGDLLELATSPGEEIVLTPGE